MASDTTFPYSLTIDIPLPDHRLASIALRTIRVDSELSPLVQRKLFLVPESGAASTLNVQGDTGLDDHTMTVLRTVYSATTNRMLRVAVNGFMESLGLVLQVMEELDVDVLESMA